MSVNIKEKTHTYCDLNTGMTITEKLPPGRFLELGEKLEKGDLALNDYEKSFKTRTLPGSPSGGAKNYYRPYPKDHVGVGYRLIEDGEIFQTGDECCSPPNTVWTSCNYMNGYEKDGLACLYRRKIDQPVINKRTYFVTETITKEVEEVLSPGRYLVPGDVLRSGDLYVADKNMKATPVVDFNFGLKVSTGQYDINAWYRPTPVEPPKSIKTKAKAKKTYSILKWGTALQKGDQVYNSKTRGWSNISYGIIGWIYYTGKYRRPTT
jgi:hypothetical protein